MDTTNVFNKKINPFIGILLLFVSIFLFAITVPIGFIYGVFYKTLTKSILGLGDFCLKIAISLDQLGNVVMQHLLNKIMIDKGGYKFGNRDETISSAIGKNVGRNRLSRFGKFINTILNFIDTKHALNSIDYYIEPVEDNTKK